MNSETQSLVPATQQAESVELTIEQVRENLSVTEKIRFCGVLFG